MGKMTIKEAIVYECYKNDLETALKHKQGIPVKFKKLEKQTSLGEHVVIPANEVSMVYTDLVKKGFIKYSVSSILRKDPNLIQFIEHPTEIQQLFAIRCAELSHRNVAAIMRHISNPSKNVKYAALCCCADHANDTWSEWLNDFTEDELVQILTINHNVDQVIRSEQWTSRLVEEYLRVMVKTNRADIIDNYLHRIHIPEMFKDKVYYRAYCMVNGYNYTKTPKEYIHFRLINYTLENSTSFVGILWMYQSLPEEFKTREISLKCCIKHFGCAAYLPDAMKNDGFYKDLMKEGQYNFIDQIDLKTMSDDVLEELVSHCRPFSIMPTIPRQRITPNIAKQLAKNGYIKGIPAKLINEEICRSYVSCTGNVKEVPAEYITEELCVLAMMGNARAALMSIPEDFKTDSFWDRVISNGYYPEFDSIPERFKTDDFIKEYIFKKRYSIPIERIPESLFTEDNVLELMDLLPNHASMILIKWHKYTKAWDKLLKLNGIRAVNYVAEQLGHAPAHIVDMLVEQYPGAISLRGITREQIEISILHFPENVLYAPVEEKQANAENVTNICYDTAECKQLSIWDILSA